MSKYYKIIPIQHLLKNNKIAKAGDVVEAGAFINLQESLDRGFCKEVKETTKEAKKKAKAEAEKAKAAKAQEKADAAAAKLAQEQADAKAAQEAADKAKQEAEKGSETEEEEEEEEESVDLSTLSEKEIIDFAKDNDFKLTKADIKAGKDAMIEAIQKQAPE